MQALIAIDSFKGSLTSLEAGNAVKEAALKVDANTIVEVFPLADGGEGTVEAFYTGVGGRMIEISVNGPLMKPVNAQYCILKDGNTAVIEMSAAAGITLIAPEERNPLKTTTYGVGEMIKDAIKRGCRRFVLGIGGSATNDGGVGMLSALGFCFYDQNGAPILPGAEGLKTLHSISMEHVIPELKECSFRIACDVSNPLCGKNGCSTVFAPQKGGTPEMIAQMDRWLEKYARLASKVSEKADMNSAGAGAAGGLGFAFLTFTNAVLESGIQIVLDELKIEEHIKNADIIVTGEGQLDQQTIMGKAPLGVAKLAKKHNKKVIAFAGCVTQEAEVCNDHGIDAYFSITPGAVSLDEALDSANAFQNLKNTAYQVFRLLHMIEIK